MRHILLFDIVQYTKGLFSVGTLGGFFLAFQLGLIGFGFDLLVLQYFLSKSVVGTIIHLSLTFIIMKRLCKNRPPKIRMIAEAKNIRVQNSSGLLLIVFRINMYILEFSRCVGYYLSSRISLEFLTYG